MRILNKSIAFIRRDFQVETSYKLNFLLEGINSLLPIVLFYFLDVLIDPSAESLQKYGGNYFFFVLIGVAFARYFQLALGTFSGSIQRAQVTGCLEAMLSTQTSPQACILMSSLYSLLYSFIQMVLMFLIGWAFFGFDFSQTRFFPTFVVFVMSVLTFMGFGIISAAGIVVLKKGDPLGWLITTGSALLGGAYFPIEVMPTWLQVCAKAIPATYSLDALRLTILKGYPLGMISEQVLVLVVMAILLLPISLGLFRIAVWKAKKGGSLVLY